MKKTSSKFDTAKGRCSEVMEDGNNYPQSNATSAEKYKKDQDLTKELPSDSCLR